MSFSRPIIRRSWSFLLCCQ